MSSAVKVIAGTFDYTWWHSEYKGWVSSLGISSICVRNDSELASASLGAFLVSFERWSSLCMVIRAGILASWANISKQKGTSSLRPEGKLERVFLLTSFAIVSLSVIFWYCFEYDFQDRVPVGWSASACAVKECLTLSESLREAIVILSSSGKIEKMLQDFPFDLDFIVSHCSSWARSGCTPMIFLVFNVKGKRPLASCYLPEGLFTSSRALGLDEIHQGLWPLA